MKAYHLVFVFVVAVIFVVVVVVVVVDFIQISLKNRLIPPSKNDLIFKD